MDPPAQRHSGPLGDGSEWPMGQAPPPICIPHPVPIGVFFFLCDEKFAAVAPKQQVSVKTLRTGFPKAKK